MDWYSRYVLAWDISTTMDSGFCVETLVQALKTSRPDIFNTDQGVQFTSVDFTGVLEREGVRISMGGQGRVYDNIFIERLWRTVKYEEVHLHEYLTVSEAHKSIEKYFVFYNNERLLASLEYRTPYEVYCERSPKEQNRQLNTMHLIQTKWELFT